MMEKINAQIVYITRETKQREKQLPLRQGCMDVPQLNERTVNRMERHALRMTVGENKFLPKKN